MNSKITVSGNIISELSERIPSNIIALNELIKNAYDAGADSVDIKIDSKKRQLIITDGGSGMDEKDINTLFHLSKSRKKYGRKNQYKRYTQGSKGLGFLSVFKFGESVTWKTKKCTGLQFSAKYREIVNSDNIAKYNVNIIENHDIEKGTEIQIELSEDNLESLLLYFSEEKNYLKVIHSFDDEKFTINLQINESCYSNAGLYAFKKILPERQLFNVKYDSNKGKIYYYYNDKLIHSVDFFFTSKSYKLEIDLLIFQFEKGHKEMVSSLFYNTNNELTPLIYINSNLFNNYDIFDPKVMTKVKTGQILNQMIGYIKITSSNSMMNFNIDRSQFSQNELTDQIKQFLEKINKKIQEVGSEYKKYLVNLKFLQETESLEASTSIKDLRKNIKDDFKFKDKVVITKKEDKFIYSIFGKEISLDIKEFNNLEDKDKNQRDKEKQEKKDEKSPITPKIMLAVIQLIKDEIKVTIPSSQIDLRNQIKRTINSRGESIDQTNIQIKVDSCLIDNGILPSITFPCSKKVEFSYLDDETGLVAKEMNIEFYQENTPIVTSKIKKVLLVLPTKKDYIISFNPVISKLIEQLNKLDIDEYEEVIACSLRSIFEICIDTIIKSVKFDHLNLLDPPNKELGSRVRIVIEYISSNKKNIGFIDAASLIGYNNLKNIIIPNEFEECIKKAHLGAHKSTLYISQEQIKTLADKAALFVMITNEMINNTSII